MILEIADISIHPGSEREFEVAVSKACLLLKMATGFRGVRLQKVIERPNNYCLLVNWDTVEDHTINFQKSDLFLQWRSLLGTYFSTLPKVVHSACVFSLDSDPRGKSTACDKVCNS